jgi:hypothetical protein
MSFRIFRGLLGVCVAASLTFGLATAVQTTHAQTITVKCYQEFCSIGENGMETCVRQQIPCPPAEAT